jgi:pimeloyl-ACP methyl ester carboxylesterase
MRICSTASRWRLVAATFMTGLAVTLTGCAAPAVVGSPHTGATPDAAVVPPGLERFYAQQLAWGSCTGYQPKDVPEPSFGAVNLECTRMEVPLDYAKPGGRTAQIAVMRKKATGVKIGSLVMNPGGPGGSGLINLAQGTGLYGLNAVSQRFDLVEFDPRGVGASTPAILCRTDADLAALEAAPPPGPGADPVAEAEKDHQDYVAKCVQNSGGVDVLANMGTRDVARDLDVLRAVLGDRKLTFLGKSYGTLIGATYAEAFPANVRALVLDGAVDPAQGVADDLVAQQAGFQKTFEVYAADCARNPACPLGTDPSQATARFQQLTRPLLTQPLQVGSRQVGFYDVVTATSTTMYNPVNWPVLTVGLAGLTGQPGGDPSMILLLVGDSFGRTSTGGHDREGDVLTAVRCVDYDRITDRAQAADLDRRARAAVPFKDDGSPVIGALDACAFWPAPPTRLPHVPNAAGLPATVVVSTTADPATPYESGVALAKDLGSSLVTYKGARHTISLDLDSCIDNAVSSYLIDLVAPPANLTCEPQAT